MYLYHDRDISTMMEKEKTELSKQRLSFYKSTLPVAKGILAVLWKIGKITTTSFFPPQYAKKYGYSSLYKNRYHHSLYYLKRQGFIDKNDAGIFYLTPAGEKEAFFAYLNGEINTYTPKKQKWDKKWRIIFFDVPEKKRHYRDYLRTILKVIGFKEFQKSIWIYPYPVPRFLKDLLFEEQIKQYTRFITTYEIEYDKDLRKKFNL